MTLQSLLCADTATSSLIAGLIEASGTLTLQTITGSAREAGATMETAVPDIVFAGAQQYRQLEKMGLTRESRTVFICLSEAGEADVPASHPGLLFCPPRPSFEQFLHTVNKAILQILGRRGANGQNANGHCAGGWFFIKSDYRMVKVNFSDILFCEGLKDYTQVYMTGKTKPIITLQNLKAFLDRLPQENFVRVHRSYIVSLNHIGSISKKEVEIGEKVIPIGNSYRSNLLD
ncbi:MAG: LytTR family transcriptional regulator, partial [Bacteroidetes bacterium]|nr:LytTR family transcriptional regulator [Bacteroidota bacterium]